MYDSDAAFDGLQSISDVIGKLLSGGPQFQFTTVSAIDPLHNSARLFGQIQTSGRLLDSMDFFLLNPAGKVAHLYAFLKPAK